MAGWLAGSYCKKAQVSLWKGEHGVRGVRSEVANFLVCVEHNLTCA